MSRLLSLAAGTVLDLTPADTVSAAAAAGFGGAGIWFDPAAWSPARTRQVRDRLRDTGTVALDVEPIIFTDQGDSGEMLIEVAAELDARFVLVASLQSDRAATVERFGRLCDRAAPAGLTLVLEFLPIMAVRTLEDSVSIVTEAARPNSGVLVDNLHLARSGGSPGQLHDVDPALLPYLQVADAPAEAPQGHTALREEALHGRLLPGEGALPIDDVLQAVPLVPLSFELRSASLTAAYPDPYERAKASFVASRPLADR